MPCTRRQRCRRIESNHRIVACWSRPIIASFARARLLRRPTRCSDLASLHRTVSVSSRPRATAVQTSRALVHAHHSGRPTQTLHVHHVFQDGPLQHHHRPRSVPGAHCGCSHGGRPPGPSRSCEGAVADTVSCAQREGQGPSRGALSPEWGDGGPPPISVQGLRGVW